MAGMKIVRFLGTAPKVSPELLPDTAAQIARNCKLYSGDLLPYPQPVVVANTDRTGPIHTLYALRDPTNGDLKWLSWANDVNIAIATPSQDDEQRFYYTGDGAPKVSNYELATGGATPYPVNSYDLGLPVPEDSATLTTTAGTFTTVSTSTYARDAGNVATIVTSTAHNLRTGNTITVAGFSTRAGTYSQTASTVIYVYITGHGLLSGASVTLNFTTGTANDGTYTITVIDPNTFTVTAAASATTSGAVQMDISSFNATSVECTVVNSTTFTYYSPGNQNATATYTSGTVDLGGLTQTRSYVFTWFTPWEEESIASKPSSNLYIKEGITVTVSNLPIFKPAGDNFVRGVRLYRTLASASGTEYYRLATLWFPIAIASVQRTTNVSRVETSYPHNLDLGSRFKISGCTVASFDITGGIVTDVLDDYTFEYAQTASNVTNTAAAGTVYHDVSENPPTTTARYWGDGSYDFTDDFDSRTLTDILTTDDYEAPPSGLQGLVSIQNSILAGFVGNQIFFSEKAVPHAWPREYTKTIEHNVVGLAVVGGSLLVLTDGYPYYITGSDPRNLSVQRIDALYPCLNRSSIVTMDYGVVYSTHDGLAVYSGAGPQIVTKALLNNDTWTASIDPSTITATYYGENYFASHDTGAFVFERDDQIGGFFVTNDFQFTASWYDSLTGKLYAVSGNDGDIHEWDDLAQPAATMEWKSKVIITKDMLNLGAARVVADYTNTTSVWDVTTSVWSSTTMPWSATNPIEFKLWADKQLIFTTQLNDSAVFRLPTGFRSDTYEVGVSGNIRVRSIHLAETPLGLKEI